MYGRNSIRLLAIAILALLTCRMHAQADRTLDVAGAKFSPPPIGIHPVPTPRASYKTPTPFRELVHAAGIIFSGTVTNIESHTVGGPQALETVSITFHVENAIRGAIPGKTLTISQWAGLWSSGQRYRIGERVALFLYPTSQLGLTSSVAGPMGRFEVDAARRILISERHRSAFRGDPVLGGKSHLTFQELVLAVRKAAEDNRSATGGVHEN